MALSVVQDLIQNPVDNVDTDAATFASTPIAGNLIVVCIEGWRNGGFDMPTGGVTDNKGNTYTRAVQSALDSFGFQRTAIFYTYNIVSSATHIVTVDPTGTGNYLSWSATEVAGAMTTDPLDKTQSQTGTTGAISTGTTAALAQAAEIVFAACTINSTNGAVTVESVSPSWVQLFDQTDGGNHIIGEVDRRIVAATTAQSCSWTQAGTLAASSAAIATFMEAGVGGTPQLYQSRFNTLLRL